jgi:hypothetical protein
MKMFYNFRPQKDYIMKKYLVVFLFLLINSINAEARGVRFMTGFLTGSTYHELPKAERFGYAMGIIDGIMVSGIITGSDINLEELKTCIQSMGSSQVVAILDKYIRDNPKYWKNSMNFLAVSALKNACDISSKYPPSDEAFEITPKVK